MSEIEGLNSLLAKLDALEHMVGGGLEQSVEKGNKIVQADAKMNAPVNHGELREKIFTMTETTEDTVQGTTYTNVAHAGFVEFGTGPVGQANHAGISPNVSVSYTQNPWFIPAEKIDEADAEKYRFPKITIDGKDYYFCRGQAAQPFLYPALKNNEELVTKTIADDVKAKIRRLCK